jgi:hypothetical protein
MVIAHPSLAKNHREQLMKGFPPLAKLVRQSHHLGQGICELDD